MVESVQKGFGIKMKTIKRVLVVHPYGIGDLLFVTPVLRALRLIPTIEKVDLLLGSRTEEMIRPNPHVDSIITVDRDYLKSLPFLKHAKEVLSIGKKISDGNYDLLLDYSLRREYAALGKFWFHIPIRAGFDYKNRGCFLTHKLSIPEGFVARHAVHYYADCAELAGVSVDHRVMEFYLDDDPRSRAKDILSKLELSPKDYVVIAPGGGESWGGDAHLKRWPLDFFKSTLQHLHQKYGVQKFLIVGSPQEKELCAQLASSSEQALSLAGDVDLKTVAALIEQSSFFAGNDGGLVHIAHALRTPLVAIYGPVDPKVYGPFPLSSRAISIFKGPVDYKKFRYNPKGTHIKEIEPKIVWDAIKHSDILQKEFTKH